MTIAAIDVRLHQATGTGASLAAIGPAATLENFVQQTVKPVPGGGRLVEVQVGVALGKNA